MSTENSQKIGVRTATIVGMNAIIGAGIFSMTCSLASGVGPAGILSYLFAFFTVWFIANQSLELHIYGHKKDHFISILVSGLDILLDYFQPAHTFLDF